MNKTNLVVTCLLITVASMAFLPGAEAGPTKICVYDPINYTQPWCGSGGDSWGTVLAFGYCVTTNVSHPFSGC
jgi:hypothetical protein